MSRKVTFAIGGLVLAAFLAFALYLYFPTKPESFPINEQLIDEINQLFPTAAPTTIQDAIYLDERHVFVPFISKENEYGVSYWAWEEHKWKVLEIDTTGEPRLWMINESNPSSYYLVWNIHPEDQVDYLKFYLVRDRGFRGVDNLYTPRVQVEKKVSLQGKSYGVLRSPDEWVSIMKPLQKLESDRRPDVFLALLPQQANLFFSYTPYNEAGQEAISQRSVNSHGYVNGNIRLEFVIRNGARLEKPL